MATSTRTTKIDDLFARVERLAYDLWWTWQPGGAEFWEAFEPTLWRRCRHNPVRMLRSLGPEGAARRLGDRLGALADLEARRDRYRDRAETWHDQAGRPCQRPIAYFERG